MTDNLPTTAIRGHRCRVQLYDTHAQYQRITDGYWDVTPMLRMVDKNWAEYARNASTKRFLAALSVEVRKSISELVEVTHGGAQSGVWVHPRVAIHFAEWLSPEFCVWVTGKIFDLMTTGVATLATTNVERFLAVQTQLLAITQDHEERLLDHRGWLEDSRSQVVRAHSRIDNLEQRYEQDRLLRKTIGAGTQTARDLDYRERCNTRLRTYCHNNNKDYEKCWLKVYSLLNKQEHINVFKRFNYEKNTRSVREGRPPSWETILDLVVRLGIVARLWVIIASNCPINDPFDDSPSEPQQTPVQAPTELEPVEVS